MKAMMIFSISFLWSGINKIRRRITPSSLEFPVPVISIGNIQAGGSGKTPLTIEIIEILKEMGKKPAVLTRGYRSLLEKEKGLLSESVISHARSCFGDEANLIFNQTSVPVFVGRNRFLSYSYFKNQLSSMNQPDVLLLDDGLQQFKIKKDLEIICLTDQKNTDSFFREYKSEISSHAFIILTKSLRTVSKDFNVNAKVNFKSYFSEHVVPGLFITGIADPKNILKEMQSFFKREVEFIFFKDHHPFTCDEVKKIEERFLVIKSMNPIDAQKLKIVTTEKDWVKIKEITSHVDYYEVLKLNLQWEFGKSELKDRLCDLFQK